MEKDTIILTEVKRGVLRMVERTQIAQRAFREENGYGDSDLETRMNVLRQVQDMIYEAEIDVILNTEEAET